MKIVLFPVSEQSWYHGGFGGLMGEQFSKSRCGVQITRKENSDLELF